MKLTKEEFHNVARLLKQGGDAYMACAHEQQQLRDAIAEHDPRLAQQLEDIARLSAQITLYIAERIDN